MPWLAEATVAVSVTAWPAVAVVGAAVSVVVVVAWLTVTAVVPEEVVRFVFPP